MGDKMSDTQITVESLLAKIGQLVVQLDVANNNIAVLQKQIEDLKSQKDNSKESTSDK